jgi:hypothetical protein
VTNVAPGWRTAHAVIDNGPAAAEKSVLVQECEISAVWLYDQDIV